MYYRRLNLIYKPFNLFGTLPQSLRKDVSFVVPYESFHLQKYSCEPFHAFTSFGRDLKEVYQDPPDRFFDPSTVGVEERGRDDSNFESTREERKVTRTELFD